MGCGCKERGELIVAAALAVKTGDLDAVKAAAVRFGGTVAADAAQVADAARRKAGALMAARRR